MIPYSSLQQVNYGCLCMEYFEKNGLCYNETNSQISNISHTKSQNLNVSRLAVVFAQSIEARC